MLPIGPRFATLQKLLPAHELRMVTSDTRTIFDLQEVDFALRFGKGDWSDGHSQKLFGEQLFPVCSPQFAEEHFGACAGVDPSSLALAPLIHEQEEKYSWLSWQQWLGHHSVDYEPAPGTYYYDNYAIIECFLQGSRYSGAQKEAVNFRASRLDKAAAGRGYSSRGIAIRRHTKSDTATLRRVVEE